MVRRISVLTALMGRPSSLFFDDDEILADALTGYFTDFEPASCFVAEWDNTVVGYLLGAKDVRRMESIFSGKIALPLVMRALRRGTFFHRKNLNFLLRLLLSFGKGEFKTPSFLKDYPAVLHINVLEEARATGIGPKLMHAYRGYLKEQGVKGVHCATMSDQGGRFFKKQGFQLLFQGERSTFRYFLGQNVPLYVYGMPIPVP
jgi:GNAT superfamily N-acetyltransferase